VTGGEKHEVLNVAWESRTSPVISESSSEKDCFLRFRTWLELMQLRFNDQTAVVILARKKLLHVTSFFNALKHFNYSKEEAGRQVSSDGNT